jgi:hypothetical protein
MCNETDLPLEERNDTMDVEAIQPRIINMSLVGINNVIPRKMCFFSSTY